MTTTTTTFEPNDSPFGDAFADFMAHEANPQTGPDDTSLCFYSPTELDEFASCARSKLTCAAYVGDPGLTAFVAACESRLAAMIPHDRTLIGRRIPNPYVPTDASQDQTIVGTADYVTMSGHPCYVVRWADGTESIASLGSGSALANALEMTTWMARFNPGAHLPAAPSPAQRLRTPDVAAVLDVVRATGQPAFGNGTRSVSLVVQTVAIVRNRNPRDLQAEVNRYADALDAS